MQTPIPVRPGRVPLPRQRPGQWPAALGLAALVWAAVTGPAAAQDEATSTSTGEGPSGEVFSLRPTPSPDAVPLQRGNDDDGRVLRLVETPADRDGVIVLGGEGCREDADLEESDCLDLVAADTSLTHNLRVALDLAVRANVTRNGNDHFYQGFIGLDLHKVFSDEDGDWGTAVVQLYMTRQENHPAPPPVFNDGDDWELVPRIVNFNFTRLGCGGFNVRVGHFEVPYGLEHLIDTNGTLRDMTHGVNLGVKADWGVSVNGETDALEYEVGWTRGTGIDYRTSDDPGIVAGRIGTPRYENSVYGVSFMAGRVRNRGAVGLFNAGAVAPIAGDVVRRRRVGLDAQWYHGLWGVLAQVDHGEDEGQSLQNALVEVSWRNPMETFVPYAQVLYQRRDFDTIGWDDAMSVAAGFRWLPDGESWDYSAQLVQGVDTFMRTREDARLAVQVRRRF